MKQEKSPYLVTCTVVLIILALLFMSPLYWIVTGSLKDKSGILIKAGEAVQWFPPAPTGTNYDKLMNTPIVWSLFGLTLRIPAAIKWLFNIVFISVMAMM